jgi:hypothetical protein
VRQLMRLRLLENAYAKPTIIASPINPVNRPI